MASAIVNLCVDPRLLHDVLRAQVRSRLQSQGLKADRIFLTNDIGGNIGSSMRNTLEMLNGQREPVLMLAVLHHDDCAAHEAGRRRSLDSGVRDLANLAAGLGINCPVLRGNILTENSQLIWTDQPNKSSEVLPFRMPRMIGR